MPWLLHKTLWSLVLFLQGTPRLREDLGWRVFWLPRYSLWQVKLIMWMMIMMILTRVSYFLTTSSLSDRGLKTNAPTSNTITNTNIQQLHQNLLSLTTPSLSDRRLRTNAPTSPLSTFPSTRRPLQMSASATLTSEWTEDGGDDDNDGDHDNGDGEEVRSRMTRPSTSTVGATMACQCCRTRMCQHLHLQDQRPALVCLFVWLFICSQGLL